MTEVISKAGIHWTASSRYVDIETGQVLTRFQAIGKNTEYIIENTTKSYEFNHNKTRGHITYTVKCRRNPQTKLPFN